MEQKISKVSYVVDTNIFLEFLLDQKQADESLALMERIEEGSIEAFITSFALHSIAVILDQYTETKLLEDFLDRVIQAKGLRVYQTEPVEEKDIVVLTRKVKLDFDDTLQYYVARAVGATLISFDRGFDKTDLQRLEPSQIV